MKTTAITAIMMVAMKHRSTRPIVTSDTIFEDIGLDALERAEIAMGAEDLFGIEITDAELEAWETIGDIVRTVEGKAK